MINKSAKFEKNLRRSKSSIAEDAIKELECLADYMPDLSDARVQALQMYYIELANASVPRNTE